MYIISKYLLTISHNAFAINENGLFFKIRGPHGLEWLMYAYCYKIKVLKVLIDEGIISEEIKLTIIYDFFLT